MTDVGRVALHNSQPPVLLLEVEMLEVELFVFKASGMGDGGPATTAALEREDIAGAAAGRTDPGLS